MKQRAKKEGTSVVALVRLQAGVYAMSCVDGRLVMRKLRGCPLMPERAVGRDAVELLRCG